MRHRRVLWDRRRINATACSAVAALGAVYGMATAQPVPHVRVTPALCCQQDDGDGYVLVPHSAGWGMGGR